MRVVVDTSAWSLFLRRRRRDLGPGERRLILFLRKLIADGSAMLPGVARQELLSGVRDPRVFDELAEYLRFFDDEPPDVADYELAARFGNRCRDAGVAASPVDLLVCALADARGLSVLTVDDDFQRYAAVLGVRLHPLD